MRVFLAWLVTATFGLLAVACDKGNQVTVRTVNLHSPASCPLPTTAGGVTTGVYLATGDFPLDPSANPPLLFLDQVGTDLGGIPADVRSLALLANHQTDTFTGVTLVPPSGDVNMLVLPIGNACALTTKVGFLPGTPDANGQRAVDMIAGAADAHTMIVLGIDKLAASFRVNLDTGQIVKMASGIGTPRERAPLVALGDGSAIVAGGVSEATPITLQTAEFYDPSLQDFDGRPFTLAKQRADHAAVRLTSGDVLLVGGQSGGTPVAELEIIYVQARISQLLPVPLSEPRVRPFALRLANGTILVGGGYHADGSPATTLEFFSAGGTSKWRADQTLAMRDRHALVALEGGGALVVNAPAASDPPNFANVMNVTPEGELTPVTQVANMTDAKLFPGADGRPVLWTGDRWLIFDPWSVTQTWAALDSGSGVGPASDSPASSPDPGLLSWIAPDGSVMVRRFSTRNIFATDPQPYLQSVTDHVVPDRWLPTMTFDTSLSLPAGSAAFVADARFMDATIDVDAPSDGLPRVVLRGESGVEVEVGGVGCPFVSPPLPAHLHVERRGSSVTYTTSSSTAVVSCPTAPISPSERIAVGVRAGSGSARAKSLEVLR